MTESDKPSVSIPAGQGISVSMGTDSTRLPVLILLCLSFMGLLWLYWPALSGPLLLDSAKLYPLLDLWNRTGSCSQALFELDNHRRVFSWWTFCLNFSYAGDLVAYQIKLVNLLLHILNSALVFVLARRLMQLFSFSSSDYLALWVVLLWAFAPIQVSTVPYGIQRMTILASTFSFLAMLSYLQARFFYSGRKRLAWVMLGVLSFLLGVLSKEITLLVPLYLYALERFWLRQRMRNATDPVSLRGWPAFLYSPHVFWLIVYLVVQGLWVLSFVITSYDAMSFTLVERLLTQCRVIWLYVQQIFLPMSSDIGLYYDGFRPSSGFFTPVTTLIGFLALAGVVSLLFWTPRRLKPVMMFGVCWYLLSHLLESTSLPLELVYLHRNYLGSVGLFLAVVVMATSIVTPNDRSSSVKKKWLLVAVGVCLLGWFSIVSHGKVLSWQTRAHAVASSWLYHTDSVRASQNYAQLLTENGDYSQALNVLAVSQPRSDIKKVIVSIQQLYLHCLTGSEPSDKLYQQLRLYRQDQGHLLEVNQALGNLASALGRGCSVVNVSSVVSNLAYSFRFGESDMPWDLLYYQASLWQQAGNLGQAISALEQGMNSGEGRALLFALDLYLQSGQPCKARSLLNRKRNLSIFQQPIVKQFLPEIRKDIEQACLDHD